MINLGERSKITLSEVKCRFGLNIFYSEISTEIAHCTHSNKDQNESKYLLSSSPRRINW